MLIKFFVCAQLATATARFEADRASLDERLVDKMREAKALEVISSQHSLPDRGCICHGCQAALEKEQVSHEATHQEMARLLNDARHREDALIAQLAQEKATHADTRDSLKAMTNERDDLAKRYVCAGRHCRCWGVPYVMCVFSVVRIMCPAVPPLTIHKIDEITVS